MTTIVDLIAQRNRELDNQRAEKQTKFETMVKQLTLEAQRIIDDILPEEFRQNLVLFDKSTAVRLINIPKSNIQLFVFFLIEGYGLLALKLSASPSSNVNVRSNRKLLYAPWDDPDLTKIQNIKWEKETLLENPDHGGEPLVTFLLDVAERERRFQLNKKVKELNEAIVKIRKIASDYFKPGQETSFEEAVAKGCRLIDKALADSIITEARHDEMHLEVIELRERFDFKRTVFETEQRQRMHEITRMQLVFEQVATRLEYHTRLRVSLIAENMAVLEQITKRMNNDIKIKTIKMFVTPAPILFSLDSNELAPEEYLLPVSPNVLHLASFADGIEAKEIEAACEKILQTGQCTVWEYGRSFKRMKFNPARIIRFEVEPQTHSPQERNGQKFQSVRKSDLELFFHLSVINSRYLHVWFNIDTLGDLAELYIHPAIKNNNNEFQGLRKQLKLLPEYPADLIGLIRTYEHIQMDGSDWTCPFRTLYNLEKHVVNQVLKEFPALQSALLEDEVPF